MRIGPYSLRNPAVLAPMAGVTDRPFRQLCLRLGAGLAVSEMLTAQVALYDSAKSRRRRDHEGEAEPRIVQIAGGEPGMLAEAARRNAGEGAQILDINMGCPAKKVCNKAAGSALLQDENLVGQILDAVVKAVDIPVTLKIRTGWDREHKNGVRIAKIAEQAGICALAVHGRTRADLYGGEAEYETIRAIKNSVGIPVIANGDVDSPEKARAVLAQTGADAVMIGRAAQGRPWIFRKIVHFLATGKKLPPPEAGEIAAVMLTHLDNLYAFYGEFTGLRMARKHLGWYLKTVPHAAGLKEQLMRVETAAAQRSLVRSLFGDNNNELELAA
ncbi:MAG: tRNA dihydrouridine synthase DusB [Gammaproteobacteria bacterium]|nr:tRNA dihydrouridine synthase DusB [Gammaproteobacteria bacterium]MBU6509792.1 tRNA dihydrouridine synthase DusB [Gammaproteobacteria bacterium]MDE1983264.1 tRNA dihydrouridine synthase DusB [Gammaproteobacteria bacterium]MDE2108457.1 tRNA dihydrouridine synthase DusB [Gammaproteobacteria bacterium]MDE2461130.1 tRNA dihydrouridine synthase DusB [Gammaproteobacteria bacterium]